LLTVLEVGKSKVKALADSVLVESPLLIDETFHELTWQKGHKVSFELPIHEGPTLLIPLYWELSFNI
jgi:hypothetical protein